MTRINTIPMHRLSDELVLNEMGEIPRVLNNVLYRIENNIEFNDIPKEFTLGKGHMKFFYSRCGYILDRYMKLRAEYKERTGKTYSTAHLTEATNRFLKISRIRRDLCFTWTPTPEAQESVLKRILDRSESHSKHTYYGKEITNWKEFLKL